jgi:hypothetical protein
MHQLMVPSTPASLVLWRNSFLRWEYQRSKFHYPDNRVAGRKGPVYSTFLRLQLVQRWIFQSIHKLCDQCNTGSSETICPDSTAWFWIHVYLNCAGTFVHTEGVLRTGCWEEYCIITNLGMVGWDMWHAMDRYEMHTKFSLRNLKGTEHLEGLGIDVMVQTGFIWLKTADMLLWTQ